MGFYRQIREVSARKSYLWIEYRIFHNRIKTLLSLWKKSKLKVAMWQKMCQSTLKLS